MHFLLKLSQIFSEEISEDPNGSLGSMPYFCMVTLQSPPISGYPSRFAMSDRQDHFSSSRKGSKCLEGTAKEGPMPTQFVKLSIKAILVKNCRQERKL